jgi:hypothetical protein
VEKNLLSYLFCSHKFYKIENYLIFENTEEKHLGQFLKNYRKFSPKIVPKLSPGSGIQKKPIPDPGVKKAPDPGSVSATLLISTHFSCFI